MQAGLKYNIIITLFLLIVSQPLRAQEMIDEDFIDNLSRKAVALWAENDADFNGNTIPEKWNKESAVILGYKKYLSFDKEGRGLLGGRSALVIVEKKRFKIKLLDKGSVNTFSELYFRYNSKKDGFGARLIKEDGTMRDLPLNKAVGLEDNDDVPVFLKSFLDRQKLRRGEYYKVPVSGLQPGDILDFVSITYNEVDVTATNRSWFYRGSSVFQFEDQYELCSKNYPLLTHKIAIETDKNTYISARSLNGAPEFTLEPRDGFVLYKWEDHNRDRVRDVNFVNELISQPLLKYTLTYASNFNASSLFIGSAGQLKNEFKPDEIALKARAIFNKVFSSDITVYAKRADIPESVPLRIASYLMWKELKQNKIDDLAEDEFIKAAFYALRYVRTTRSMEMNELQFLYLYTDMLDKKEIPYDILISTPNTFSELKNLVSENELIWFVKVKDKYVFFPDDNGLFNNIKFYAAGNYCFKLPVKKTDSLTTMFVPQISDTSNVSTTRIDLQYNPDSGKYIISQHVELKGLMKERISDRLLYGENTYTGSEDYVNPPGTKWSFFYASATLREFAKYFDQNATTLRDNKKEVMKENAENEFGGKVSYDKFKLVSSGRSDQKPILEYDEYFTLKVENIKKAGKKLLLNLPGLVGSQLQIKGDERVRNNDIDVTYPRQLNWTINFTIPKGYTIDGLENLNMQVDNEAGTFTSSAAVSSGILSIKVKKAYKLRNIPKSKWDKMLSFVDAAYNFSQKMVLLRPENP